MQARNQPGSPHSLNQTSYAKQCELTVLCSCICDCCAAALPPLLIPSHTQAQHEQQVTHLTRRLEAAEGQVEAMQEQLSAAEVAVASASSAANSAASSAHSEVAAAKSEAEAAKKELSAARAEAEAEKNK